jgi:hypothetical protein
MHAAFLFTFTGVYQVILIVVLFLALFRNAAMTSLMSPIVLWLLLSILKTNCQPASPGPPDDHGELLDPILMAGKAKDEPSKLFFPLIYIFLSAGQLTTKYEISRSLRC